MDDVFAAQLMKHPENAVALGTPLSEAAADVAAHGCTVATDESGRLAGVITASHIVQCVANGMRPSDILTADCIRTDTVTVRAQTPIKQLSWIVEYATVGCVPVIDREGKVIGVLDIDDVRASSAAL